MKILVTGATGRIGSRLIPRLLQRGDAIRILVRHKENAQPFHTLGAELVVGDLMNLESLQRAVIGMDAVIHLAAFFRGATPEEVQKVNVDGTLALAHAAMDANVHRFVFSSTNLAYGPGEGKVFKEEDPLYPASPYPMSKATAEHKLMEFHRKCGLDLRILRLAFVYGEGDPHLTEGLQWFRQWNASQTIHLIHHMDVSQAIMLAVDKPEISGEVYNVADEVPTKIEEILHLYGETAEEEAFSRPLNTGWLQIVDTSKIRNQGFRPVFPTLQSAISAATL